jgi:CubicO group peptidase (beta-lactamase class C family)
MDRRFSRRLGQLGPSFVLALVAFRSADATQDRAAAAREADEMLATYTADKPGLSVLVASHGAVIYERTVGSADLEHQTPITPATRFLIGSVSKQFTAFAVTKLAHDGRLHLDDDIRIHFPELPDYGRRITPADLIHHTSGLRDQVELMALAGTPVEGLVQQRAALAMIFRQRGLNFSPGSDFHYSNTNYTLLAELVRRTSGTTFRRYLAEYVFTPLAMSASYLSDSATEVLPNRATGYSPSGDGFRRALLNYGIFGSTGVWTTPRDLIKWSAELLHPKVFDAALIHALETPGRLANGEEMTYAGGLVIAPFAGHRAIYHAGGDPGFQSILVNFPDDDAAVIVLSNGDANVAGVATKLTQIFLGSGPSTVEPSPVEPDPARASRLAGWYTNDWDPSLRLEVAEGRVGLAVGGVQIPLQFLPDGSFFVASPANRFAAREDGALVGRSGLSGTPIVFRRVVPWSPKPAELSQLAGDYRCDEIDTTYRLTAANTHVVMSSLRDADISLFPADRDNLETRDQRYPAIRLTVQRDGAGRVVAFSLATGRVRGLEFERVR